MPDAEAIHAVVDAAVRGDRAATDQLLQHLRPLVLRYCRARLVGTNYGSVSAEDIAQDVCLAVLEALPRYAYAREVFVAFVYGIAAHKLLDSRRRASREHVSTMANPSDLVDSAAGPEPLAIAAESRALLRELLATLPARQYDILVMRLILGWSSQRTTGVLRCTPSAIRVAQHRALDQLRQEIVARRSAAQPLLETELPEPGSSVLFKSRVIHNAEAGRARLVVTSSPAQAGQLTERCRGCRARSQCASALRSLGQTSGLPSLGRKRHRSAAHPRSRRFE